jgi:Fic family protein
MLYWPAFEFSFSLDVSRLLPYIAAIEAGKRASARILPPQWRERPASEEMAARQPAVAVPPDGEVNEIQLRKEIQMRKYQLLVSNGSRAHAWVRERFVPGSAPMSLAEILDLHRMVGDEAGVRCKTPGVMRTELQVIVGRPTIGFHVGCPAEKLPRVMNEYIQFLNSESMCGMPAAIHALVSHFFITTIHPFDDGNGRVSRLVAAAILFQRGYNGHGFYALSTHFYQNEERYHRILYKQQQDHNPDLTEVVAFGLEGLALELQGINSFINIKLQRNTKKDAPMTRHKKRMGLRRRTTAYRQSSG